MGWKNPPTHIRRGLFSPSKSAFPSAQNAWTDTLVDTRNVAATELVVAVGNVADTPPYFVDAAPVTRLPENAGVGDFVMDIVARHDVTLKSIFAFFERMRAAKIFISTARGSTRLHSQLVVKNICYP
jgi:hypothetical protein